jgi:hypothetical protein
VRGGGMLFWKWQARSGGTGRRAGLKIRWPQGRVGSTPSSGTNFVSAVAQTSSLEFPT